MCEYEKPIFDAKKIKTAPPNSPEILVQSDLSSEVKWNTPGAAQECSLELFPQSEYL